MILRKIPAEKRESFIWYIFALAQISMAVGGILGHFFEGQVPFLVGMLAGFSMVGNLFFLSQVKNLKKPFNKR
jgi:hypothetical protein